MKRNRTVDFLKFILSLMIVPIHADLFIDVSRPLFLCFTLGLVRVGVPFFFIVSGYYLKERVDQRKSIKNSINRDAPNLPNTEGGKLLVLTGSKTGR